MAGLTVACHAAYAMIPMWSTSGFAMSFGYMIFGTENWLSLIIIAEITYHNVHINEVFHATRA